MHTELRQSSTGSDGIEFAKSPMHTTETPTQSAQSSPGVLLLTWSSQAGADGEATDGKNQRDGSQKGGLHLGGLSDLKPNTNDYLSAWQVELPTDLASSTASTAAPCRGQAEEIQMLRHELATEVALRKQEQAEAQRRLRLSEDANSKRMAKLAADASMERAALKTALDQQAAKSTESMCSEEFASDLQQVRAQLSDLLMSEQLAVAQHEKVERRLRQEVADLQASAGEAMAINACADVKLRHLKDEIGTMKASEQLRQAQYGDEFEALRINERRKQADLATEVDELLQALAQQRCEQQAMQGNVCGMFEDRLEAISRSHAAELALANATWARRCADESSELQQKAESASDLSDKTLESLWDARNLMRKEESETRELAQQLHQHEKEASKLHEQLRCAETSNDEKAKADEEVCERLHASLNAATRLSAEWQQEATHLRSQFSREEFVCKERLSELESTRRLQLADKNQTMEFHQQIGDLERRLIEWRGEAQRMKISLREVQASEQAFEHSARMRIEHSEVLVSRKAAESEQDQLLEASHLFQRQECCLKAEIDMLRVENQVLRGEASSCGGLEAQALAAARSAELCSGEAREAHRCLDETLKLHSADRQDAETQLSRLRVEWSAEAAELHKQVGEATKQSSNDCTLASELEAAKASERHLDAEAMALRSQLADAKRRHGDRLQAERRHAEKHEDSLRRRVRQLEDAERSQGKMMHSQLAEDMEIMTDLRQRADDLWEQLEAWRKAATRLRSSCKEELDELPVEVREDIMEKLRTKVDDCSPSKGSSAAASNDPDASAKDPSDSAFTTPPWCAAAFSLVTQHFVRLLMKNMKLQEGFHEEEQRLGQEVSSLRDELLEARASCEEMKHGRSRSAYLAAASLPRPSGNDIGQRSFRGDHERIRDNARLEDKIHLLQASLRGGSGSPTQGQTAAKSAESHSLARDALASLADTHQNLGPSGARSHVQPRRMEDAKDSLADSREQKDYQNFSEHLEGTSLSHLEELANSNELLDDVRSEMREEVRRRRATDGGSVQPAEARTSSSDAKNDVCREAVDRLHKDEQTSGTSSTVDRMGNDTKELWLELHDKANELSELRGIELVSEGDSLVASGSQSSASCTSSNCNSARKSSAYPTSPPNSGRTNGMEGSPKEEVCVSPDPHELSSSSVASPEEQRRSESAAEVFERAEAYCEAQKFEDAVPLFRRVLVALSAQGDGAMHSVEAEVWACLGVAVQSLNDVESAIESYNNAVKLDPSLHVCFANLATLYSYFNDTDHAHDNIAKALALQPENEAYCEIQQNLPTRHVS
jgi:hypothetical protein